MLARVYVPTVLDACEPALTLDHNLQFLQFTLFADPKKQDFGDQRSLVLQPHLLLDATNVARLWASCLENVVTPIEARWESELPAAELPDPEASPIDDTMAKPAAGD